MTQVKSATTLSLTRAQRQWLERAAKAEKPLWCGVPYTDSIMPIKVGWALAHVGLGSVERLPPKDYVHFVINEAGRAAAIQMAGIPER